MLIDDAGCGREYDDVEGLPNTGSVTRPDNRPILLPASIRPCAPDEYLSDKGDILDLVRRRIEEQKLEPKDIRKSIAGWRPEDHWRLRAGCYDMNVSQRRAYQIAIAVGLKRTRQLPFSLRSGLGVIRGQEMALATAEPDRPCWKSISRKVN